MDLALVFEDAQPFRFTVDQYLALNDDGLFDNRIGRVELIDGMIVCANPQWAVHSIVATRLAFRLHQGLAAMASPLLALVAATVLMRPHSAPDPDIAILAKPDARYFDRADAALLVEVSLASLRRDMIVKRDLYAASGVPEYWVVDINAGVVHRFWQPHDGVYQAEPPIPLAGSLASLTMPALVVDGAGIL